MPREWVGSLATLVSLVEVGFWIVAVKQFDFASGALQLDQPHSWFRDSASATTSGQFGFSLWLVGLTVVCGAAACGYAWWAGRERPRAYFGLLLFLTGSVVGVFSAQDLLLFYAFFEAMLIPLYVLIGVWGGAGRLGATIKFVVYTVAGSLLMLAAIIVYGLQQGTFDLTQMGTSTNDWLFLGFAIAFAVKAPLWPFHGWLPDAYRESPPEVVGPALGRDLEGRRVRLPADRDREVPRADARLPRADPRARRDRPRLRLAARLPCARRPRRRRLLVARADGADHVRHLRLQRASASTAPCCRWSTTGCSRCRCSCSPAMVERRTATGELSLLGGMARGRPALATVLMTVGVMALAVPLSSNFAGEFLILAGVFQQGWGGRSIGAVAIVLAAMYMLRLISAVLHRDVGPGGERRRARPARRRAGRDRAARR